MAVDLEFITDPAAFIEAASTTLARSPVESTVVETVANRAARDAADGRPPPPDYTFLPTLKAGRMALDYLYARAPPNGPTGGGTRSQNEYRLPGRCAAAPSPKLREDGA